jgi:hypothetical protein
MSIEQLIAVAPPPQFPVFAGMPEDWVDIEQNMGVDLPADYKQLINIYGFGYFGGYLCPLNPFLPVTSPLPLYRLQSVIADLNQSKEYVGGNKAEGVQPLPVFPEDKGLLPWGVDDNRGLQCWQVSGNNLFWPLLILDYDWSEEYLIFSMSATEFLTNWLTNKIIVSHYPPFPVSKPLFVPYDLSKSLGEQLWKNMDQ